MKNETKKTNEIVVVVTLYCLTAMALCTPVPMYSASALQRLDKSK